MLTEQKINHLTPSGSGAYTRERRQVEPVEQRGHYGYVGWVDPSIPVKKQVDSILRNIGSHIENAESRHYNPDNPRRAQIKVMVGKGQLDALIAAIGPENVEGIVQMTGGEYSYVLCGQTAATEAQWSEYNAMAQSTHNTMVAVARNDGLSRSIPPIGNQSGYDPDSRPDPIITEPEAASVVMQITRLTAVIQKTGKGPRRDVTYRIAGDTSSTTGPSDPSDRNNEFNIGYLLPDQSEKHGIAPVYIDQQSLSKADAHTRETWVKSIVRIWGPKFGWDEQKVDNLFDEIASGKNKSWICAVKQKGTLVAAAIADVATIADQNGVTKGVVIESNEWGVDEETSTKLNDGSKLPGIGSLAVTLVHATAALRCLDESGNVVGLEVDGKRYPTAVYAEVNAATDIPACKAALRTQMSATKRPNGQIGCMYGHVMVNGKPHGVFMIMQLHPEDMKALVNGKGEMDFVRLIGYSERHPRKKNRHGNLYCWKSPEQRRRRGRHK